MRTVQDIVSNAVTELQLLRLEVEDGVPPRATIDAFDRTVQELAGTLRKMGHLTIVREKQLRIGPALDENAT